MPRLMTQSLDDYTVLIRSRYARRTGRRARSKLLDEFCNVTGFERKYAIKVLNSQRRRKTPGKRRGAKPTYTKEDIKVLKSLWLLAGQPCGKRFAGEMLALWLDSWERHHGSLPHTQHDRLLKISAAQIDRVLAPYRCASKRRRVANPSLAALQKEIAVRCEPWQETTPGALEIDTVALCGGSMSGAIVWALDATDIFSGWTEVRAVWNRSAHATCQRMAEIDQGIPFPLRCVDFDNGTEFLNAHFIAYFRQHNPEVPLSRSRPYHKNDNAHIEQKNYTHVRQLLGDDRFADFDLIEPLNDLLIHWSLWNNLYGAQRRLLRKERDAHGKVKRYHETKALTPWARLQSHPDTTLDQRRQLEHLRDQHDPIDLAATIEQKMQALYEKRSALEEERLQLEAEFADLEKDSDKDTHPPKKMRVRRRKHRHSAA